MARLCYSSGRALVILLGLLLSFFCFCSMAAQKLYIGNISWATTEHTLIAVFSAYGHVLDATIPIDTLTGKPRGNGYVTMSTDAEALDAIHGMNDQELDGRRIVVRKA